MGPTEGLLKHQWETFGQSGGSVRRPCLNETRTARLRPRFGQTLHGLLKLFDGWSIGWVVAAEFVHETSGDRHEKISPALCDVVAVRPFEFPSLQEKFQVFQNDPRADEFPPGKPAQLERLVDLSLRISKDRERPLLDFLIRSKSFRSRKRRYDDVDPTRCEPRSLFRHLPEVFLAWQSGEMPKEDDQRRSLDDFRHGRCFAVEREKRKFGERNALHQIQVLLIADQYSRQMKLRRNSRHADGSRGGFDRTYPCAPAEEK